MIDPFENGNYYRMPNNTHLILSSVYTQSVLGCLIQHCDKDWHCYPGQEVIAQGLMSTKQVKRSTDELTDKGIITVYKIWRRGGGIYMEYDVHIDKLYELIKANSPIEPQSNGHTVQWTDSPVQSHHSPLVQSHHSPNNNTHSITIPNNNNISTPLVVPPNEKSSDKKKKFEKTDLSDELKDIIAAYEKCGGVISTSMIAERLSDAEKEFGAEIIIAGFKKASDSGVHGIGIINYCRPIWRDFKDNGIPQNKSRGGNGARSDHPAGGAAVDNGEKWREFLKADGGQDGK